MNNHEPELMEVELRRHKPASPPGELMERLLAVVPARPAARVQSHPRSTYAPEWWRAWRRWLAPISAFAFVAVVSLRQFPWAVIPPVIGGNTDNVQISHTLVSSYDAVGELPGGEPVRFRVREWTDSTVLRDTARRLVVAHSRPRMEVVPVEFETY